MGGSSRRKSRLIALAAAVASATLSARAQADYWDADGATPGAGGAMPAGTWGVDNFWSSLSAGNAATHSWTPDSPAIFAAGSDATGAYTVTVSGAQSAGPLTFEDGSVTLAGGTLTLNAGVSITRNSNSTQVIDSIVTGTNGLGLSRSGSVGTVALALGGNNNYTGETVLTSSGNTGILQLMLNHNNALGAITAGNGTTFGTQSEAAFVALPGNRVINETITIRGGATSGAANGQLRNTGGVNTWAGNILINGLQNSTGTGQAGLGSSSGTLVITGTISSVGTGANTAGVAFGKLGVGTVILRSANANVGFNRVYNGILEVQSDGALGVVSVDGSFDSSTILTSQSGSTPTVAFRAPPASSGFSYNTYEIITTGGLVSQNGLGMGANGMIDNLGGDNTFTGSIRFAGSQVTGMVRASIGAQTGSSLELSGRLFASAAGAGTTPATPDPREIRKVGGGTVIISGVNDTADGVTSGDADQYRLHGKLIIEAGAVTLRSANPSGGVLLGNSVGPMTIQVDAGTKLSLDNSLAANNNRVGPVAVTSGQIELIGNAGTPVNQTLSGSTVGGNSTITITQPTNGSGATTTLRIAPSGALNTLRATTVSISTDAKLDLTDNKLVVAAGDVGTWNGSGYTGVTGQIQSGRGDGSWNGDGIVTSMSDATTSVLTTLAVAAADDTGYVGSTFGGVTIASGDVLGMYTWGGDADLNGELNGDDYFFIDSNVINSGTVFGFHNGDFDYNGEINGDDYFIIDSNLTFAQNSAPFPTGSGAGGLAAIPEPAIGILGLPLLLHRRRRLAATSKQARD